MSQPTAVDWLVDQLCTMGYIYAPHYGKSIIDKTIKKAKEKEKEQIEKAYEQGTLDGYEPNYGSGKQYYSETYGKSNGNRLA